jgi:hypothetical protein
MHSNFQHFMASFQPTFEGLYIVIIQKFKFQKMCIKVHNDLNIINTSFELFDLEIVQYQPP